MKLIGGCGYMVVFMLLALHYYVNIGEAVDTLKDDELPKVSKSMQLLVHEKFKELATNKPMLLVNRLEIPKTKTVFNSVSLKFDGRQPRFDDYDHYGKTAMQYSTSIDGKAAGDSFGTFTATAVTGANEKAITYKPTVFTVTISCRKVNKKAADPSAVRTIVAKIWFGDLDKTRWDNTFSHVIEVTDEIEQAVLTPAGVPIVEKIVGWLNEAKLCGLAQSSSH